MATNVLFNGINVDNKQPADLKTIADTITDRNSLDNNITFEGMLVYVKSTNRYYVLTSENQIGDGSDWDELGTGDGGVANEINALNIEDNIQLWIGTLAEYNAIATPSTRILYVITDDFVEGALVDASTGGSNLSSTDDLPEGATNLYFTNARAEAAPNIAAAISKLNGIETGAQRNVGQEFTQTEKDKLAGIETGATADQTAAEIKTAYESNADTNALTDAALAILNNITLANPIDLDALETRVMTNDGKLSVTWNAVTRTLTVGTTDIILSNVPAAPAGTTEAVQYNLNVSTTGVPTWVQDTGGGGGGGGNFDTTANYVVTGNWTFNGAVNGITAADVGALASIPFGSDAGEVDPIAQGNSDLRWPENKIDASIARLAQVEDFAEVGNAAEIPQTKIQDVENLQLSVFEGNNQVVVNNPVLRAGNNVTITRGTGSALRNITISASGTTGGTGENITYTENVILSAFVAGWNAGSLVAASLSSTELNFGDTLDVGGESYFFVGDASTYTDGAAASRNIAFAEFHRFADGDITSVNTNAGSGLAGGVSSGPAVLRLDPSNLIEETTTADTDNLIIEQADGDVRRITRSNLLSGVLTSLPADVPRQQNITVNASSTQTNGGTVGADGSITVNVRTGSSSGGTGSLPTNTILSFAGRGETMFTQGGDTWLRAGVANTDTATYPNAYQGLESYTLFSQYENYTTTAAGGLSFNVSGGFQFSSDGLYFFTSNEEFISFSNPARYNYSVTRYELAGAWNLTDLNNRPTQTLDIADNVARLYPNIFVSEDGTTLILSGSGLRRYTLSTAWDLTTATQVQDLTSSLNISVGQYIGTVGTTHYFVSASGVLSNDSARIIVHSFEDDGTVTEVSSNNISTLIEQELPEANGNTDRVINASVDLSRNETFIIFQNNNASPNTYYVIRMGGFVPATDSDAPHFDNIFIEEVERIGSSGVLTNPQGLRAQNNRLIAIDAEDITQSNTYDLEVYDAVSAIGIRASVVDGFHRYLKIN